MVNPAELAEKLRGAADHPMNRTADLLLEAAAFIEYYLAEKPTLPLRGSEWELKWQTFSISPPADSWSWLVAVTADGWCLWARRKSPLTPDPTQAK